MLPHAHRMELLAEHFFAGLHARLAAMQSQGCDVIRMDEGSPDMPPAPHIIEALAKAARRPEVHSYQPHRGFAELRQAWAEMYQRVYGVTVDPDNEVLPLMGSKEGIFHLPLVFINPGDVVLAPDPGYITYTRGALLAGGKLYLLPLLPERDYLPDLQAVPPDILRRAKLLWLNYPNNPTAATASVGKDHRVGPDRRVGQGGRRSQSELQPTDHRLDFFTEAVTFARQNQLLLCHDAAYAQVTFDGYRAPSPLEVPGAKEVCVEFNTLSKSHNMAGWRVAALIGNAGVIKAMYTLKTNVDSSHFRPVMEAAVAAMTGDQAWLQQRNDIYRQRRDVVLRSLQRLGLFARTPSASLYVWFAVPERKDNAFSQTSAEFAATILEQAHVSLTPGSVFGSGGEGFVRLSLTAPTERVEEAMERIETLYV